MQCIQIQESFAKPQNVNCITVNDISLYQEKGEGNEQHFVDVI